MLHSELSFGQDNFYVEIVDDDVHAAADNPLRCWILSHVLAETR